MIEALKVPYKSFYDKIPVRKPDSILDIQRRFNECKDPKVNGGVGVINVQEGDAVIRYTPNSVKEVVKNYELGEVNYNSPSGKFKFGGNQAFVNEGINFILQKDAEKLKNESKLSASGMVGGTSCVAIFSKLYKKIYQEDANAVVSNPTWGPHKDMLEDNGIKTSSYPHVTDENTYNKSEHLKAIKEAPSGTLFILQPGAAHNTSGVNAEKKKDVRRIAKAIKVNEGIALVDAPYLGLGNDIPTDTNLIPYLVKEEVPSMIALSFAKIGGLYKHRPALGVIVGVPEHRDKMQNFLNSEVRKIFSTSAAFGEEIMGSVLENYSEQFVNETEKIKKVINERKKQIAEISGVKSIAQTKGMFCEVNIGDKKREILEKKHHIFLAASGPENSRINAGGIVEKEIPIFAKALNKVI
jgi:aspartate/tyrosine/aromatic aminotransferase